MSTISFTTLGTGIGAASSTRKVLHGSQRWPAKRPHHHLIQRLPLRLREHRCVEKYASALVTAIWAPVKSGS